MADYLLNVVAAGVSPAVEPGILPGGERFQTTSSKAFTRHPEGETPSSTAGETPAATGLKT